MQYTAKTFFGLESILADEIDLLGGTVTEIGNRVVHFEGDLRTLYKVNLSARTALRVLRPILHFMAHNETVLYKRLRRFDWTKLMDIDQTFMVNAVVNSEYFTHSKYVGLKTKDAIVDLFRLKHNGQRPSVDTSDPEVVIDIHCRGKEFTVSIDSSGQSLHRRGYRQSDRQAPLNEALAAGMILLSGWDKKKTFYDPMCGSGTLLSEAYLIATNTPPRMDWQGFAFMNWDDYDEDLWDEIYTQAKLSIRPLSCDIIGSDRDRRQVWETRQLFENSDMSEVRITLQDFFTSDPPSSPGLIVTNPPYGQRIGDREDMDAFYKEIGDTFKKSYSGWTAWVISANKESLKKLGLRTSQRLQLYNGPLECKYHRYDMYRGSRD
ncbi:MAG: class I SAM-dependent RNA methyltransferase [Bacteroidota bacterium]